MVLKMIILFATAFFAGFWIGDLFVKKNKEKKPLPKTEAEIKLIKTIEKQEIYN
jgi:hypothetical protein